MALSFTTLVYALILAFCLSIFFILKGLIMVKESKVTDLENKNKKHKN